MERQDVEARIARLEQDVRALIATAEVLRPETLYRVPGPEDWSVMKVLAHAAEVLPYWSWQARDVAGRAQGNLPFGRTHEDPDRIAAVEGHASDTLESAVARLQAALAEASSTLRSLPLDAWSKTANHARRGEMSIADIVDQFLVQHLGEHLAQARSIAAAVGGA